MISLTYTDLLPEHTVRFVEQLLDGKIIGRKCPECGQVYVPPKGYCPVDVIPLLPEHEVEVGDQGTVTGFTVITPVRYYGQTKTEPFIYASVLLDGAVDAARRPGDHRHLDRRRAHRPARQGRVEARSRSAPAKASPPAAGAASRAASTPSNGRSEAGRCLREPTRSTWPDGRHRDHRVGAHRADPPHRHHRAAAVPAGQPGGARDGRHRAAATSASPARAAATTSTGGPFAFVQNLEAVGAWPPISESHVEMDGAWALYEAWVRLQEGDIDLALVFGSGKSSPWRARSRCIRSQLDPYYLAPLGLDPASLAALQARALLDAGKATERDFAEVVARNRAQRRVGNPLRAGERVVRRRRAPRRAVRARAAAPPRPAADLRRRGRGRARHRPTRPASSSSDPVWIRGIDHRIEPTSPACATSRCRRRRRWRPQAPASTGAGRGGRAVGARSARRSRSCARPSASAPDVTSTRRAARSPPTR